MANMSYCRFRNTLSDLHDCHEALANLEEQKDMSDSEKRAMKNLIELCIDIALDHCDLVGKVIERHYEEEERVGG